MLDVLQKQYALVKQSRELVFAFIETVVKNDFTKLVTADQNQSIRHLLVHNADCYLYWLAYMALEEEVKWPKDEDFNSMLDIRALYNQVDEAMVVFIRHFQNNMDITLNNIRSQADNLNATPLMIFTHVVTHEFHHKGQVMAMCRQLGYLPPVTDVYNFFYGLQ